MAKRTIEGWEGDDNESKDLDKNQGESKNNKSEPNHYGVGRFENPLELLRLIQLRNSGEGYSSNSNQNLEEELKEQRRLRAEGVTLDNSPIAYVKLPLYATLNSLLGQG